MFCFLFCFVFFFFLVCFFFFFFCFGVRRILDQLVFLVQRPFELVNLLAGSVPRQVNFFINYVALQV